MTVKVCLISVSPSTAIIANYNEIVPKATRAFRSELTVAPTGPAKCTTMDDELKTLEQEVRAELVKSFAEGTEFEIAWERVERQGLSVPDLTHATPAKVAEVIKENRAWVRYSLPGGEVELAAIADEKIEAILTHCYYASLQPEEGRYPRFRVVVAGNNRKPIVAAQFSTPFELTANALRKLAPALAVHNAVLVAERGGTLYCDGIVEANDWETSFLVEEPRFTRANGLLVRVEDPGELIVSEGLITYHVRGAEGWPEPSFGTEVRVYGWLKEVTALLAKKCVAAHETGYYSGEDYLRRLEERCGLFGAYRAGGVPHDLPVGLWSRIVAWARDLRHGGAFAVVPGNDVDGIEIRHRTQGLDLGAEIVRLWKALSEENLHDVEHCKHKLLRTARTIANLSAVDGCVVLNRALQIHGFGGMIQIDDQQLKKQARSFARTKGVARSEDELAGLGARHRSAIRLCKAFAHMLVFVVSQDGDLRVFSSDIDNWYESRVAV